MVHVVAWVTVLADADTVARLMSVGSFGMRVFWIAVAA